MRIITAGQITEQIKAAVLDANRRLPQDITGAIKAARQTETSDWGCHFLDIINENTQVAARDNLPLCQDTGLVTVEVEIGQEVHIQDGFISDAINEGVRQGYREGYFRASIVRDPLRRVNTGDNTPAIISYQLVPGDRLLIQVMPKGGGSENMGRAAMLKPAAGWKGIKEFVINAVEEAGSNPCPPLVIGVGIGGNMALAGQLAKHALLRPINSQHPDPEWAEREKELLQAVNATGVGPQGFGGNTTALGLHIETYPTHIACLPVAVNLGCHVTR
ncbi:MAG: fumarate hydratase, partial [Methylocystaceae bacterium]